MHWFERKAVYSVGFGVAFALLTGAAVFYFNRPDRRPATVRIGYGTGAPVRKDFLEKVAAEGKKHHLDIRAVATKGTDNTLSLIDRNELELGLVAGAIEDRASRNVLEIAPLFMEPLQLLVKGDIFESVSRDFGQLRGKTIDLDSKSSATDLLSEELLRFIGLNDAATGKPQYQPVFVPQGRLADVRDDSELPDAIFQLAGVPSPTIRSLIVDHNYRLVALPFGSSFNLDRFKDVDTVEATDAKLRLDATVVEEYKIPAFAYRVLPPVPAADTRTVATRLILVGSPRLSDDVVRRMLDVILSPEVSTLAEPPLTVDVLSSDFQFDRHPGTDAYLNGMKPYDIEGTLDAYGKLVEVWGIILTIYVSATRGWKWWQERKGFYDGKSVGDFLGQVMAVEAEMQADCPDETRVALDQRLSDIKTRSIERLLQGHLEDADDLPSLLVTLADTRTKIWRSAPGASISR